VGCRGVTGWAIAFNHCGLRVTDNGDVTNSELLPNKELKNHIVVRHNVALDRSSEYDWMTIGANPGEVLGSLVRVTSQYEGDPYWPTTETNSNSFVFDVIVGAGGTMPPGVLGLGPGWLRPGICGLGNLHCR
jgi:hypothetical protein